MEMTDISWPGWETGRLIGRGSFGAVYEIERKVFDETEKAALKVISIPQNSGDIDDMYSDGYDEESITSTFKSHLQSIVAEYSLMRKMNGSANIVNCDDVRYIQHDDGIGWDIFIKMELLTPLTKALSGDVDEKTVIKIAKDMCGALELCKKHGIVHRDIKPQNIFVSEHGDYKLGDFGIAKTVEKTMGGTKIGTYKYMAPEVYNNQPYGSGADIYSLGLVLYWLLNERRMPFMPLPPEKLKAGVEESSRHRRLSGEKLPEPAHGGKQLKQIVLKACAYDPKGRYISAAAMLEDLNMLSSDTVTASSVVILNDNPDEKQEDAKTTGPVFGGIKKETSKDSVATDPDATVGPTLVVKQPPVGEPKTETLKSDTVDAKDKKEKKCLLRYILIALGVVALLVLFLLLRSCGENGQVGDPSTETTGVQNTKGSTVALEQLVWSDWSDWSATKVDSSATREVQTQTRYRYRDKETTTSSASNKDGWTKYDTTYSWGNYGSWSSWSTSAVSDSDSRKVETKTQYRYRDISYSTEHTSWGSWSSWQNAAVSVTDLCDVETRVVYQWYCYYCDNCGTAMPYTSGQSYSECYTKLGGCGRSGSSYSASHLGVKYLTTSSSEGTWCIYNKRYVVADGQKWYISTGAASLTQYRYRTRSTQQVANYGSWTSWGDTAYSDSSTRQVETRTVYRYCDRSQVATYHFYRWGSWSSWSESNVSATNDRQVENTTYYRYRDQVKTTTYYFKRWTDWSSYSDSDVTPTETIEVQTKTQYRYKSKGI